MAEFICKNIFRMFEWNHAPNKQILLTFFKFIVVEREKLDIFDTLFHSKSALHEKCYLFVFLFKSYIETYSFLKKKFACKSLMNENEIMLHRKKCT